MTELFDLAVARLLDRVADTETAVGERFPLFADPATGEWVTSRRGSWMAGFWTGQLWLRARLSGSPEHVAEAKMWTERLAPAAAVDTVTRGLTLWYGAAASVELGLSDSGTPLARQGAERLCATFDPRTRVVPWGTGFGDPGRPVIARVDGLAGTVPLLAWAGHRKIADRHLRTHLELCTTGDAFVPAWEHTAGRWRARPEPPAGWSRGRAWLLLALADAGHRIGSEFSTRATELFEKDHKLAVPPAVPGSSVPDTSAAAITAVALCKLGRLDAAAELVEILVRDHLLRGPRPNGLLDGCYDLSREPAISHELIWGNYFLLLALAILTDSIPPTAI